MSTISFHSTGHLLFVLTVLYGCSQPAVALTYRCNGVYYSYPYEGCRYSTGYSFYGGNNGNGRYGSSSPDPYNSYGNGGRYSYNYGGYNGYNRYYGK